MEEYAYWACPWLQSSPVKYDFSNHHHTESKKPNFFTLQDYSHALQKLTISVDGDNLFQKELCKESVKQSRSQVKNDFRWNRIQNNFQALGLGFDRDDT